MQFSATEAGYADGLGGASNSGSGAEYHYVLFGSQDDAQHPHNCGIYFEFDDQKNGSVDGVQCVLVSEDAIRFVLNDALEISVRSAVSKREWQSFLQGIEAVFGEGKVVKETKTNPN